MGYIYCTISILLCDEIIKLNKFEWIKMPSLISLPDQKVEFLYQGTLNFIIIGRDFFYYYFFGPWSCIEIEILIP